MSKLKLNFAKRVTVPTTIKNNSSLGNSVTERLKIQQEINKNRISIDRECFLKTPEEKLELKRVKKEYKNSLKTH